MPYLPRPKRSPRPASQRRPSGRQEVYRGNWQQFSEWFRLNVHTLCQSCLAAGVLTDITPGGRKGVTDHIIQVSEGGAERDQRNLMGLCKPCHDRKSNLEQKGMLSPGYTMNEQGEKIPTEQGVAEVVGAVSPSGGNTP